MSFEASRWMIAGTTDRGLRRPRNEDSFVILPSSGIAVVADGMGGHPGGDVASAVAARTTAATLRLALENGTGRIHDATPATRERAMRLSVLAAHEAVVDHGRGRPELSGMGTTTAALALTPDGLEWTLGNVGDSRIYRLRGGALTQLTRDDTWLQKEVDAGRVRAEDAHGHPEAHVLTQCLGLAPAPEPRVSSGDVEPGDVFLLCSDGLIACLADAEIAAVLRRTHYGPQEGAERAVRMLVDAANAAGGVDNITAVVLVRA